MHSIGDISKSNAHHYGAGGELAAMAGQSEWFHVAVLGVWALRI